MTMKCQELWKWRGVQVAVAEASPLPMARKKSGSRSSEPHPCPNAREQLEHAAHKKVRRPPGAANTVCNAARSASDMGVLVPQIADTLVICLHPFVLPLNKRFYIGR
jgi:hypothetical protein